MGLRDDLLTWQEIRQLCDVEALTPTLTPTKVLMASMIPERPQIAWPHQYHWFAKADHVQVQAGSTIFARAAWGGRWRKHFLSLITQPSVLVSTFYDLMIQPKTAAEILAPSSNVQRWFAVQTMASHPQLTQMPLGVKHRMKPILQAGEIRTYRDILLYSNFSYLRIGKLPDEPRRALWHQFNGLPWVTTRTGLTAAEYVSDVGRSRFVLSPPGIGWDCYRTYEAIAMGAIPIVLRKRPITDVCEDLPVMLVDDWSEVTEERLRHYYPEPKSTQSLTLNYWRQQIQEAAAQCREKVMA